MNYEEKLETSENERIYGNILIKGTKVCLRTILRELSKGNSTEAIIKKYPEISISNIYTCLEYASELVGAIDFKKSLSIIKVDRKKNKDFADKIMASYQRAMLDDSKRKEIEDIFQ